MSEEPPGSGGASSARLDALFEGLPARLGVQEVADLLGMSPKGVYKWIKDGVIPAYKLGSTWHVLRDELRDTMAAGSNRRGGIPARPGREEDGA